MTTKIIFSKKTNKEYWGKCRCQDRNYPSEIILFNDCDNKRKVFIHECIHDYLFDLMEKGNRQAKILNKNEIFVDGLAVHIDKMLFKFEQEVTNG